MNIYEAKEDAFLIKKNSHFGLNTDDKVSTENSSELGQLYLWAKEAIAIERNSLEYLSNNLDTGISRSIQLIVNCKGRVVLTGIGKSGHICKKIASTMASTGTPSVFVHPSEASHGDLGMITNLDIVICVSKSGESKELFDIIDYCKRYEIKLIGMTENSESSLGKASNTIIEIPKLQEACPHNLAPTTSSTMMLVLGDAIAISCLRARQFSPENFRNFHPGGKLGKKLMRAVDVMHTNEMIPIVQSDATLREAILVMSTGRFGCVGVVDEKFQLIGIYTDGDLRRQISNIDLNYPVNELMNKTPLKLDANILLAEIVKIFSEERIPSVFICEGNRPIGIIHVHDLLQKGMI